MTIPKNSCISVTVTSLLYKIAPECHPGLAPTGRTDQEINSTGSLKWLLMKLAIATVPFKGL